MSPDMTYQERESELVRRIRNGDRKALLDLFDRNRRPVVTLVTRNGGSGDDGEDVLQEAIVILWEKIRKGVFEERSALSTFIYGVARKLWLRRLRQRSRDADDPPDPDMLASDEPAIDDVIIQEQETAGVEAALGRLDALCRSLLVLFYWENLPMEEIAQVLGLANANTAKAKKYQCKERLRLLMQKMSDG